MIEIPYVIHRYETLFPKPTGGIIEVYRGSIALEEWHPFEVTPVLEMLFDKFNIDQPSDYRDMSMSSGFIVSLIEVSYLCLPVGWELFEGSLV